MFIGQNFTPFRLLGAALLFCVCNASCIPLAVGDHVELTEDVNMTLAADLPEAVWQKLPSHLQLYLLNRDSFTGCYTHKRGDHGTVREVLGTKYVHLTFDHGREPLDDMVDVAKLAKRTPASSRAPSLASEFSEFPATPDTSPGRSEPEEPPPAKTPAPPTVPSFDPLGTSRRQRGPGWSSSNKCQGMGYGPQRRVKPTMRRIDAHLPQAPPGADEFEDFKRWVLQQIGPPKNKCLKTRFQGSPREATELSPK